MSQIDLESVIEDSVNDFHQNDEVVDEVVEVEAQAEDTTEVQTETTEEVVETQSTQVGKPGTESEEAPVEDEFSKKFGISSRSVTGRENRIPYSRVKKIVEKNEKDTRDKVTQEFQPRIQEFETKIKDLESRATRGGDLESLIDSKPKEFIGLLSQHPAYKGFFDYISQYIPKDGQAPPQQQNQPVVGADDPMPQPNKKLSDGSLVYDMDGLQALLKWQSRQTEANVSKSLGEKYEPIRKEWEANQKIQQVMPIIDKQIAEARTWPNFDELEPEITKLLETNQELSLEGAYRMAYHTNVVPKLQAQVADTTNRDKIRAEVIAELKKKSGSPSVGGSQVSSSRQVPNGPRSLEEIIAAEVEKIR